MSTSLNLNVLSIGGSRNIGYFSSLKLLGTFFPHPSLRHSFHSSLLLSLIINHCSTDSKNLQKKTELGATVTFLLRTPSIFDTNSAIQKYVSSGTARLIKGDALVREDVERAWKEAAGKENKPVDVLLFTVGTFSPPQFHYPTKLSNPPLFILQRRHAQILTTERIHHIAAKPRNPIPPQRPLNHPFSIFPTPNNNNLINRPNTHIPRLPPTSLKAFIRIPPPCPS